MSLTDYLIKLGMDEARIKYWMTERYDALKYWMEDFIKAHPDKSITLVDENGFPLTGHVRQDATEKLHFVMQGLYEGWI